MSMINAAVGKSVRIDAVDTQGVATLWWDVSGQPVNVFDERSSQDFLQAMEALLGDPAVTGIVIASARPEFHAGADIRTLQRLFTMSADQVASEVSRITALLRRMELSGKTIVAAINGHALGGGLELALACHARIVADDPRVKLGLPEVKIGLIPGFGGTQRLGRLTGALTAMQLIGEGREIAPAKAKAMGIVDAVVPTETLLDAARQWAIEHPGARQPWDGPKYRVPGGEVQSAGGIQVFAGAAGNLRKVTVGKYPAPVAVADSLYHGLQLPFEQGQARETRNFVAQVKGEVAPAMVRTLFTALNAANTLAARPEGEPDRSFARIGIVGAGLMGAGIAHAAASRGIGVVLLDRDEAAAAQGRAYTERLGAKAVSRGKLTEERARAVLERIEPGTDYSALAQCDAVIEAVFEDRLLKISILRAIEAAVRADCLLASNTSTLPIGGLAEALELPERFLGLHFFSPVEKMPLLEIISGARTSRSTLASAFDLAKALRKTPVAVNDGRAFFTTRIVSAYMAEGLAMLGEGVSPALIENAGRMAGMPMGPLRLSDMVNIDLAVKISDQTRADLGDAYDEHPGIDTARSMVALGRLGEKAKAGFYEHDSGEPRLWPDLAGRFPPGAQPNVAEVQERLLYGQGVEVMRCFAEGVIRRAEDADLASILGWGFPPFTGGIASWIRRIGPERFAKRAAVLAGRHGARFAMPAAMPQI